MSLRKPKLFSLLSIPAIATVLGTSFALVSCANTYNIDKHLKKLYTDWYNGLTVAKFEKTPSGGFKNLHCTSEQQAINLYAINWGHFWNEYLHKQEEPITAKYKVNDVEGVNLRGSEPLEIRGEDYKYIDSALAKSSVPTDMIVYHGVEYQEIEFWDQLQNFVPKPNEDGDYDFSQCVGKTITSYGYISTTFNYDRAYEFANGWNWTGGPDCLPLKQRAFFVIDIKKGTNGAAYLADFKFSDNINFDNQILIKRNSKFMINKVEKSVYKGETTNIFYLDMLNE